MKRFKSINLYRFILFLVILILPFWAMGTQTISLRGEVFDQAGISIPGANIVVKGKPTIGTITDIDGRFSITTAPDDVLLVSFIGYKTSEVPIQGRSYIRIILEPDIALLDESVIVAFGQQKRVSVTGSIESIKPQEFSAPVRSLSQSIGGRLAGVVAVQRSGEPGKDDAQFWIRGVSTFTGNQNPLVLVDGIERPLENVDPLEIESFSVLKDASATAVYGVRGANGVILINTRRGVDGPAVVDARFEKGYSMATQRPQFMGAYNQALLYNEGIDATPGSSQAMKFSDQELNAFKNHTDLELYPDVDWQDLLMRDYTGTEKLSVNISGGGKTARYFAAVSAYSQDGQYKINPGKYHWVPEDIGSFGSNVSYKRYNFRTNVDMDLSQFTTVSLGIQGNVTDNVVPGAEWGMGSDGVYNAIINTAPYAFPPLYKDGKLAQRDVMESPYNLLANRGYVQTTGNELRSNLTIRQDFSFLTQGLGATVRYAYDAVNWNNAERRRQIEYYTAIGRDVDGNLRYNIYNSNVGADYLSYISSAWGNKSQYFEASFDYDRTFGKHTFGGLLLYNMRDFRNNIAPNYISSLPNRSLGLAGRATYGYDMKYFIETNLGYNGSENFPKGQRMGFFPSVAIGWIVSGEDFMKDQEIVTWLKVRGSAGQVGSDQIPATRFAYMSTIVGAGGFLGFGQNYDQSRGGLREDQLAVSDITWEVATKYNLGIEFGLFNDLRVVTDLFYEKRENIFLQPQTSEVLGYLKPIYSNMGVMDNRGIELTAEYSKVFGEFSITTRGNVTFVRNRVIEDGRYYQNYWQDMKGTRYGERLLYDALHLFTQEEIDALPDYYMQFGLAKSQLRPGDIRYRDVNDDGRIDENDRIFAANPSMPETMLGFGATLAYKNFDLSFLFQGALGATSYLNAGWLFYPFQSDRDPKYMGNVINAFGDRWTPENPDPYAFAPRPYVGVDPNNYKYSTWWARDTDYLRLRNLEVGYTFPSQLLRTYRVENARIFLTGINLLTFSKFAKEFWDPEVGADAYPIQASLFLGINVKF